MCLSLLGQLAVLPPKFVGPDTGKYLEIARKQMNPEFWGDPAAFDGNYWPMLYPTFLNLLIRISGDHTFLLVLQAVMAMLLVVVTWCLAFPFGRRTRVVVAFLVAMSPAVWSIARTGGYEILLALLICTALALLRATSVPNQIREGFAPVGLGALSGVLVGLAILVQNKALIVLPVMVYLALRMGRPTLLGQLIGLVLTLLPWALRNQIVLGNPLPFTKNGPVNIWIGNNPDQTLGGFMDPPPLPPGSHSYIDATARFIISQPEASFSLLLRRLTRLLEPSYIYPDVLPIPAQIVFHGYNIVFTSTLTLLVFVYVGGWLWRSAALPQALGAIALVLTMFFAVHLPFLAESRYMAPMNPLAIVVAVPTLGAIAKLYRNRFHQSGSSSSTSLPGD
jgi:hypothetical protein